MQADPPTARRTRSPGFLAPLLRATPAAPVLQNMRSGRIVASHLIAAFDSRARKTGLLHHSAMAAGDAMIIAPSNAIHTCFMRFPIDLIFVSRDGLVLKTRNAVPPWRASAAWSAFAVIELAADSVAASGTVVGDRLLITCPDVDELPDDCSEKRELSSTSDFYLVHKSPNRGDDRREVPSLQRLAVNRRECGAWPSRCSLAGAAVRWP